MSFQHGIGAVNARVYAVKVRITAFPTTSSP